MRRNFLSEAQKYINKNRNRRTWKHIVIALACVVVFCTTYALILPAITVEQQDVNQVVGDAEYQNDEGTTDGAGSGGEDNTTPTIGTGEQNFENFITGVTIKHKQNSWENWQDVEQGTVKNGDLLRFNIEYTLPGGTLSYENPSIFYELPDAIKSVQASRGIVYQDSKEAGTYTISQDGRITITFNQEYIEKNANNGQALNGYIAFESSVENINFGDSGSTKIQFNDKQSVDIKVEQEVVKTGDVKVEKSASQVNNGKVTYTITVSSEKGTATNVTLNDIMTDVAYESGFEVKDKNGNTVNVQAPAEGDENFNLTLDKMDAGDTYTITYTAKLDKIENGTTYGKNKVTVNSTDSNNNELKSETEVTSEFNNEVVKKTGVLSDDKKQITWTITINKSKQDITGYTLSDILNGEKFTGQVQITPEGGETQTITIGDNGYTFPAGSNKIYTITYTTSSYRPFSDGAQIKNKAILTPPSTSSEEVVSDEGSVWVDGFNPLSKKAEKLTISNDETTATVKWHVLIDGTNGEIPEGWVYEDYLQNDQYFTDTQKQEIIDTINKINSDNNYGDDSKITIDWYKADGSDTVKGFKLTFPKKLEQGTQIELIYESTAPLSDDNNQKQFSNSAKVTVNNKTVSANDTVTYKPIPVVSKYDLTNNSTNDTNHNYDEIQNQILGWGFKVTVPKRAQGQNIVITEKLPEGVSLLESDGLKVLVGNDTQGIRFDEEGKASLTLDNYIINFTKNSDNTITINIPKELTTGTNDQLKEYKFEIQVKINQDYNWDKQDYKYVGAFTNEVIVNKEGGDKLGSDTQTQTITKEFTDKESILDKTHENTGESSTDNIYENNIIPYSIVVNKDKKDLVAGSDTITLKDVINFQYLEQYAFNISLVPDSFHVYKLNGDVKGDELSSSEFKYTFVPKKITEYGTTRTTYTLSIEVPDSEALIVEYKYKVNSNIPNQININNVVSLEGSSIEDSYKSDDRLDIKIVESSAGVDIKGISICKVDSENYGIVLPGAKFKLYRWDGKKYIIVESENESNTFITDDNGQIVLNQLAYNTAYKLVEYEAPDGYTVDKKPYYFYILNSDTTKNPLCKPDNFKGTEYDAGSAIYFENQINSTQITVNKKWFNPDGTEVTGMKGSQISFELWRKIKKVKDEVNLSVYVTKHNEYNPNIKSDLLNSTYGITKGSTVTLSLTNTNDYGNAQTKHRDIYIDGTAVEPKNVIKVDDATRTYVYTFTISEDTDITGSVCWGDPSVWSAELEITPPSSASTETDPLEVVGEKVGEYTIDITNHWTTVISEDSNGLKLKKEGTNEAGEKIYYAYYVKEINSTNYDTSYENNGGITEGTITIKNTLKENPEYVLPETGRFGGDIVFILGGMLLMAGSLVYIYKRKHRRV